MVVAAGPRRTPLVLLESANLLSGVGNGVALIVLPWLVLDRTGNAASAGLVVSATLLPLLVASLIAGTVVDRIGRKRTAIGSDVLSGLSVAAIPTVAWASELDDEEAWQKRVTEAGARPTPIIDRYYFRSIYFREPSGVLFEIATKGPGFSADEDPEHLGERLSLPPNYESLRSQLEQVLTPLKQ